MFAIGIGIGISFARFGEAGGSSEFSATATLSQNLEITFDITTDSSTYAGIEWGPDPDYLYSVFDPNPGTSHTLVIDETDGIVETTDYIWRPYTTTDPLDNPTLRSYGTDGTITTGTTPVAPGAPTGLTLGTPTGTSQPLSWTAPASTGGATITDYIIEYSTDNVTFNTFSDGPSAATSATVTGLLNGTLYYYRVSATNSVGTGPTSSVANGSTASDWTHVVSSTMGFGSTASTTRSTGSFAVSIGQLVIVAASWENNDGTSRSVTDSAGNTYTALTLRSDSPRQWSQLFYTVATNASASNVATINTTASVGYSSVVAVVFNHPSGTVTVDSEGGGAVASTQDTSTAIDPTFTGAGIVVYAAKNYTTGTTTNGSGWSLIATNNFFTAEYQIVANGNAITGVVDRSSGSTQYADAWVAFNTV